MSPEIFSQQCYDVNLQASYSTLRAREKRYTIVKSQQLQQANQAALKDLILDTFR